jgi:hypothetical protein
MINPDCRICFGLGWVSGNQLNRTWHREQGSACGAGMPCEFNGPRGLNKPVISKIIEQPNYECCTRLHQSDRKATATRKQQDAP